MDDGSVSCGNRRSDWTVDKSLLTVARRRYCRRCRRAPLPQPQSPPSPSPLTTTLASRTVEAAPACRDTATNVLILKPTLLIIIRDPPLRYTHPPIHLSGATTGGQVVGKSVGLHRTVRDQSKHSVVSGQRHFITFYKHIDRN